MRDFIGRISFSSISERVTPVQRGAHLRQDKPMSERKRNAKSAKQNTKGANILLGLRTHLSNCFAPFVFCFALFVLNQVSSSTQSTSLPNTPGAFSLSWRICARYCL